MNHMDRYFGGYTVPDELKRTVTAICTRFAISGECDPMYIANLIAHRNGFGDGCGRFESVGTIDLESTAEHIQRAYGCNITPNEKPELADIISTGTINKETAIKGLAAFGRRIRHEMRICDPWRVDYLKYLCGIIDRSVNAIAENRTF